MILLPLGVIWIGYAFAWYGFANLKGPGVGVLDVILPARTSKLNDAVQTWYGGSPNLSSPTGRGGGFSNPSKPSPSSGGGGGTGAS